MALPRKDAKNVRFYVAMTLVLRLLEDTTPSAEDIVGAINPDDISDEDIQTAFTLVWSFYESLSADEDKDDVARGSDMVDEILNQLEDD